MDEHNKFEKLLANIPKEKHLEVEKIMNESFKKAYEKPIPIDPDNPNDEIFNALPFEKQKYFFRRNSQLKNAENLLKDTKILDLCNENQQFKGQLLDVYGELKLYIDKRLEYRGKIVNLKRDSTIKVYKWMFKNNNNTLTRKIIKDLTSYDNLVTQDPILSEIRKAYKIITGKTQNPLPSNGKNKGWTVNL